jgi:F-type H+-transporting ATPase subunit delta
MKKKISNQQYAEALYEVTKDVKGEKLNEALRHFVLLLVKNYKLKQAERIIVEFEKYAKRQAGVMEIEITSAYKLENSTLNHIKKVFGEEVDAVENIDESLLGGVVIKTEDKILDGSLKTQLLNLKNQLL